MMSTLSPVRALAGIMDLKSNSFEYSSMVTRSLSFFATSVLLITSIAGSLNASIDIGDVVLATDTLQHDMDATGFGYEPGVIPRMETSIFVADEKLRQLAKECCEKVNTDIKVFEGRVVSGDQFISDKAVKDRITNQRKYLSG